MEMRYVYRLLNDLDDPSDGLTAKDPFADEDVDFHVAFGSRSGFESQFISTTASYDAVYVFALKTYKKYVRIVKIDLKKLRDRSDVTVIDLTDEDIRDDHIESQRAENFARKSEEVLIVGYIPASCIERLYQGPKLFMPEIEPDYFTSYEDSDSTSDDDDDDDNDDDDDDFRHEFFYY